MIETTVGEIDGVQFLRNIKILEPDDTLGGMGVHRISLRLEDNAPEWIFALKLLGLRRVGEDLPRREGLYVQYPLPYLAIKIVQCLLKVYWMSIIWLYDNARMFKAIPPYGPFSWKYFTPYTWYRKAKK